MLLLRLLRGTTPPPSKPTSKPALVLEPAPSPAPDDVLPTPPRHASSHPVPHVAKPE